MSYQQVPITGMNGLINQLRALTLTDWTVVDQNPWANGAPSDGRWVIRSPASWPSFYVAFTQLPGSGSSLATRCHVRTYDTWDIVTHTGTGGANWASDDLFTTNFSWGNPNSSTTLDVLFCVEYTDMLYLRYRDVSGINLVITKFTGVGWSPANPYVLLGQMASGTRGAFGGLIYEHTTGEQWQQAGVLAILPNGISPSFLNATGSTSLVPGTGFAHVPFHVIAIRQGFSNDHVYVGELNDLFCDATLPGSIGLTWTYGGRSWKGFPGNAPNASGLPSIGDTHAYAIAFA